MLFGIAPPHRQPPAKQFPPPSVIASGTLPSEAIQRKGRLVWIASPCGFAMTWGRSLNGTSPEACSVVLLSLLIAACSTEPAPVRHCERAAHCRAKQSNGKAASSGLLHPAGSQ
ncbi:MAG: hypothetical protein LBT00_07200 [Spirochaetaceae bacterium]|nr:hypothetical protein [Spirochaetaceae bacterium]